mgnify:CR=1 FL=1
MNKSKYMNTLENFLKPSIDLMKLSSPIHLDDSASCHRGADVDQWHTKNSIDKIIWPGNSPDLNPIENLWGIMKKKLNRMVITNEKNLIEAIHEIWNNKIPKEEKRKLLRKCFNFLLLSTNLPKKSSRPICKEKITIFKKL